MLRASSESVGKKVAVKGVLSSDGTAVGVDDQELLLTFAEAAVLHDQQALFAARDAIAKDLGSEALVDAAAVVGNFERMNRIADGCGISLGMLEVMTEDLRNELEIDHYSSAANTQPVKGIKRLLMKATMPLIMRRIARARAKSARESEDS